ncbi:d4e61db1-0c29-4c75-9c5d-c9f4e1c90f0d [Sclerotinia trifoliorum]|uniref:D4e61db1-0c29-4c75-9c5d-c9f4e1c90f0d n=1 Tax=Sclerotinia trifoliorum TaxID=28548 RepID=A0A8H2W445_9HELO|nr:d4e61db1-0c29-4c75-9c5d-c9f4e1c90f0d [Sclerotinia trifoliorum]
MHFQRASRQPATADAASKSTPARRRSRFASIKHSEVDSAPAKELYPGYSEKERSLLGKRYTAEQIAAIEAAEEAVDVEDLKSHGVIRTDLGGLRYMDDLSMTQPVIDKKIMDYRIDPNWTLDQDKIGDEFVAYMDKVMEENPEDVDPEDPDWENKHRPNRLDSLKALQKEMGDPSTFAFAPQVPGDFTKEPGKVAEIAREVDEDDEENLDPRDPDGVYTKLRHQTGLTMDEILSLDTKILVSHRVVNQTRLGKIEREAKGQEPEDTNNNAKIAAIKNMQPVPRYEERTIYGDVGGRLVQLKLSLWQDLQAVGIHDLAAKVPRSRNKMNTVKATYQALMKQRIPDEIARVEERNSWM